MCGLVITQSGKTCCVIQVVFSDASINKGPRRVDKNGFNIQACSFLGPIFVWRRIDFSNLKDSVIVWVWFSHKQKVLGLFEGGCEVLIIRRDDFNWPSSRSNYAVSPRTSMWKPCRTSYEWGTVIGCGVCGFLVVHIPNAVGCTVLQYHILVSWVWYLHLDVDWLSVPHKQSGQNLIFLSGSQQISVSPVLLTGEQLRGVPTSPSRWWHRSLQRSLQGAGACSSWIEYESYCWDSWRNCCGYPMTDPNGAAIYGVPWIPSIYPSHVSIYTIHGSYGYGVFSGRNRWSLPWKTSMLKGKIIEQSGPQQKEDNTVKMGRLIQPSINGG